MKSPTLLNRSSQRSGFTLIELLVVIGIIAILAGVLFPAATGAINAAKRAKAANMANQIQTAVLAYNTEYSVYPVPSGTTTDYVIDDTTGGAAWAQLDQALCGNISPSTGAAATPTVTNTRGIAFLNLKSSDVFGTTGGGTQDAPKNPMPSSATQNIYFNIAMDSDYDGVLGGNGTSTAKLPNLTTVLTGSSAASMVPLSGGTSGPGGGSSTAGVAVWANCNGTANTSSWSSNFVVKTY